MTHPTPISWGSIKVYLRGKKLQIADCWHLCSQAKDKWILELPVLLICSCGSQTDTNHFTDGSSKVCTLTVCTMPGNWTDVLFWVILSSITFT